MSGAVALSCSAGGLCERRTRQEGGRWEKGAGAVRKDKGSEESAFRFSALEA